MKKQMVIVALAGTVLGSSVGLAGASIISEIEANNTLNTAQNIDSFFSTGSNADIFNSSTNPWVSINATGDGTYDYFSFTANAGVTGYFDIDYGRNSGGNIDTEIALWDAAGNVLFERDDNSSGYQSDLDPGTVHRYDPSEHFTFTTSGTYVIGVAEYHADAHSGHWTGNIPDAGDTYTLQVSLTDHATPGQNSAIPEPATMLLFSTGLVALVGSKIRKKN